MDSLRSIFDDTIIPVGEWSVVALDWLVANFRDFFQLIKKPAQWVLSAIENGLVDLNPLVVLVLIGLLSWQFGGRKIAATVIGCFVAIGLIGAWTPAMTTLAIVITCVVFCCTLGIPIGIIAARSDRMDAVIRPIMDLMQTIPSFVYLVPVVMLFGIGNVAGVIVTVVYALPPVIRLTNLGIRQVDPTLTEAIKAFGADDQQTLLKVQLPLAMPTIMAGVNQTIMMTLSMVVVASMISVTGLGLMVLRGIGSLDMNQATVGGLGIVLLAVAVDRFSQSLARTPRERGARHWYQTGPVALCLKAFGPRGKV